MAESSERFEGAPLIRPSTTDHPLYESVVEACRSVYDPEIPVNIYDLGLVYTVDINPENDVSVTMTLTAIGEPGGDSAMAQTVGLPAAVATGMVLDGRWFEVGVTMTLTAPGCPVAGEMPGWVAEAIEPLPGVKTVNVEITWDPPWGMDMMSDEARLELGFM